MDSYGVLSILPPLLALGMAIKTKQVYVSLLLGIWLGWTIMNGWNPLTGIIVSVNEVVGVFGDRDRTLTILLTAMIGALIAFTQYSGGMEGFIERVSAGGLVNTRRSASVLAWLIGFVIFVEGNVGVFVSGPVSRPIFDRLRISREKLAYILDSTAAAKATVIPLNSWGAYIIGLLAAQGIDLPLRAMLASIPLNIYALLAILLSLFVALFDTNVGPMKEAERRVREEGKLLRDGAEPLVSSDVLMLASKTGVPKRTINMLIPILTLVIAVLVGLFITGDGNPMNGDGTASVFWALGIGLVLAGLAYRVQGILTFTEITDIFMKGVGGMIPIVILLLFAFVIGDTCRAIGTGDYVARAVEGGLPAAVIPAALFIVSGITSFSTGTSWGTWAIMMPIAIPMVDIIGLHSSLVIASVLGGGIFGDHCSPISDSTILSSMSAGTDHIDHVRTQLPYALGVAGVTVTVYLVLGLVL
jgi:tetracycline resistance efflux pump